jgi:hypothetical protein
VAIPLEGPHFLWSASDSVSPHGRRGAPGRGQALPNSQRVGRGRSAGSNWSIPCMRGRLNTDDGAVGPLRLDPACRKRLRQGFPASVKPYHQLRAMTAVSGCHQDGGLGRWL